MVNSNDTSFKPAEVYSFFCKMLFGKNEKMQTEAGSGPFNKNMINDWWEYGHTRAHLIIRIFFVNEWMFGRKAIILFASNFKVNSSQQYFR